MRKVPNLFQLRANTLIKMIGLGVLVLLLIFLLGNLPIKVGKIDFRAYWSASYLLAHGENFADDAALLTIQRELTEFDARYAMKTWNPPWVLVWLLPYTLVGFDLAASLWLMTNVGALFFSIVMSWQILFPRSDERKKWLWIPLSVAMLFPSTIVSLRYGQVNLLVLAGIVGFLAFYADGRDMASGFALALTTFKPHLVYLVLPIMILHTWKQQRWRILRAFFSLLAVSVITAFLLRPTLFMDYFQGTMAGNLLAWESATVVTYLSLQSGWPWIRLIAVVLLPLTLVSWFYWGEKWSLMKISQVGILVSIITMPFGWSYDFVLLLLPLTQIVVWLVTEGLFIGERLAVTMALFVTYIVYFFQRTATPSELYFHWVPLIVAVIYGWLAWRCGSKPLLIGWQSGRESTQRP